MDALSACVSRHMWAGAEEDPQRWGISWNLKYIWLWYLLWVLRLNFDPLEEKEVRLTLNTLSSSSQGFKKEVSMLFFKPHSCCFWQDILFSNAPSQDVIMTLMALCPSKTHSWMVQNLAPFLKQPNLSFLSSLSYTDSQMSLQNPSKLLPKEEMFYF